MVNAEFTIANGRVSAIQDAEGSEFETLFIISLKSRFDQFAKEIENMEGSLTLAINGGKITNVDFEDVLEIHKSQVLQILNL